MGSRYSKICATGSYLPANIVTNDMLSTDLDTTDEWIFSRTGIRQRHIVTDSENSLTMAANALKNALDKAKMTAVELDGIVVATMTPAQFMPSTACLLQGLLGMRSGVAFDLNAACSGFVYGLNMADLMIRSGAVDTLAVIGVDAMSKVVDWQDRSTCVLFGDGAGAVILKASDHPGIIGSYLSADGTRSGLLEVKGGLDGSLDELGYLSMAGRDVFKFAVSALEGMVPTVLDLFGLKRGDIDWLVPHQANLRIIKATAKALDLPLSKVVLTIEDHANTSAASIPLALDVAVSSGKISQGDTIITEAFGAGFTWGANLIKL